MSPSLPCPFLVTICSCAPGLTTGRPSRGAAAVRACPHRSVPGYEVARPGLDYRGNGWDRGAASRGPESDVCHSKVVEGTRRSCGGVALQKMPFNFDSQGHAYIARRTSSCGDVTIQRVIHHHPISVESPAQCPYRPLHALDPATRKTIAVALIVKGNHLVT